MGAASRVFVEWLTVRSNLARAGRVGIRGLNLVVVITRSKMTAMGEME